MLKEAVGGLHLCMAITLSSREMYFYLHLINGLSQVLPCASVP